jgi:IS605 OrfB family transposase
VIGWAVQHRIGTLTVGDPCQVLDLAAGRRHNLRLRQWQIGRTIAVLRDKAEVAGIVVHLVDERGTSSTCPTCRKRITKPAGRDDTCPVPDRPGVIPADIHHHLVARCRRAGRLAAEARPTIGVESLDRDPAARNHNTTPPGEH